MLKAGWRSVLLIGLLLLVGVVPGGAAGGDEPSGPPLFELHYGGALSGIWYYIRIYPDGRVRRTYPMERYRRMQEPGSRPALERVFFEHTERGRQLNPQELEHLKQVVNKVHFMDLKDDYPAGCFDVPGAEIRVRINGRTKTVGVSPFPVAGGPERQRFQRLWDAVTALAPAPDVIRLGSSLQKIDPPAGSEGIVVEPLP